MRPLMTRHLFPCSRQRVFAAGFATRWALNRWMPNSAIAKAVKPCMVLPCNGLLFSINIMSGLRPEQICCAFTIVTRTSTSAGYPARSVAAIVEPLLLMRGAGCGLLFPRCSILINMPGYRSLLSRPAIFSMASGYLTALMIYLSGWGTKMILPGFDQTCGGVFKSLHEKILSSNLTTKIQ